MGVRRSVSLRSRLVGMMAMLFLLVMVTVYLGARGYGSHAADVSYDRLLAGSAISIAETLSIARGEVMVDIPYSAFEMLSAAPDDRVFYRVFGPVDAAITGYGDLPSSDAAAAQVYRSGGVSPAFFNAEYRGEMVRFALLGRQVSEPGVVGWIWVQVGHTRKAREALAHETLLGVFLPITLMTVIALLVVWFGVARALDSLGRAGREISRREPSDLQPITEPVPREVEPFVHAINLFMNRLSVNMEMLRAFIAEAAHQMRTPLAALRAQAQEAMESDDPQELKRGLRAVDRNAAKLTRLLNQLLSDATVNHRSDLRRFERFDLATVLRRAVRETVPSGSDAQVRVRTPEGDASMLGDGVIMGEAIKNLVDNALRHAGGDDARIEIELERRGADFLVRVADRGTGIPVEQRDAVFERFVRGNPAVPGAGLGLPIVRQAAVSHAGTITLHDREGGGLVVEMLLPGSSR